MFLHLLCILSWAVSMLSADSITLPTTIEIDLVFPLNQTYTLVNPFPVIFVIQNAAAAWGFGFDFDWNITGIFLDDDGSSGRETSAEGFVYVGENVYNPPSPPSDPFIVVNSSTSPNGIPLVFPAGKWTLGWSYSMSNCTPISDTILRIGGGIPAQGSISFTTVEEGGASPDFTSNCPTLAGQIGIVKNWTGCPQPGMAGSANPCGAKLDALQASSISSVLAFSTVTPSNMLTTTGTSPVITGSSSTLSISSAKGTNLASRERLDSGLLEAAAAIAGLGILLL